VVYGLTLEQKEKAIDKMQTNPIEGLPSKGLLLNKYFNSLLEAS
jgi:hypothetical protein